MSLKPDLKIDTLNSEPPARNSEVMHLRVSGESEIIGPNTMPRPTNVLFSYEKIPDDKSPSNAQYSLSHHSPSGMTIGSEYRDLQKMLSKKMERES